MFIDAVGRIINIYNRRKKNKQNDQEFQLRDTKQLLRIENTTQVGISSESCTNICTPTGFTDL